MNRPTRTPRRADAPVAMARRDADPPRPPPALGRVTHAVITCERCRRLREYCARVGVEKRAAYRDDVYWAKPVPGFGDPRARIVLVGLAPAAHGANRTGRMFTGDGAGGSGDFLARALHAAGLATQPMSVSKHDGQTLIDTWMTAAVRCAPPDNKPTPQEMANCSAHLDAELTALPRARVLVALGRIAFDTCVRWLQNRGVKPLTRPVFAHGATYQFPGGWSLVASYHPSRQNTHTGRLTPAMLQQVCETARTLTTPSSWGERRASRSRDTPQRPP